MNALAQRREAIRRATEVRSGNATIKREMRRGELSFGVAVELDTAQSAPVLDLLRAIPGVGRVKAMKALSEQGVGPYKRVGAMSPRQRRGLVDWARRHEMRRA